MSTRKILIQARELISEPETWCRYSLREEGGRFCAVGAVMEVTGDRFPFRSDDQCGKAFKRTIEALRSVVGEDPATYNNSADNQDCVLAMFDAAIEAATD